MVRCPILLAVRPGLNLTATPSSPDCCQRRLLPLSNDLTDVFCGWSIIWVMTEACVNQLINFCWAFLGNLAVSQIPNRWLLMSHYLPQYNTEGENVCLHRKRHRSYKGLCGGQLCQTWSHACNQYIPGAPHTKDHLNPGPLKHKDH